LLCDFFLRRFAERDGKPIKRLSPEARNQLVKHRLGGNVRQLEHVLLNAWVLVDGSSIDADDLALDGNEAGVERAGAGAARIFSNAGAAGGGAAAAPFAVAPEATGTSERFRNEEKRRILEALESSGWNKVKAAQSLGMARRTFYRRLQQYSII
jgi:DNA-binding NtrC family response regulator